MFCKCIEPGAAPTADIILTLLLCRVKHREYTFDLSKSTNPYFFFPPFAGLAVANAAHTFIRKLAIQLELLRF